MKEGRTDEKKGNENFEKKLESKYILTRWTEADREAEVGVTFLYRVVNGKAQNIFGSLDIGNPQEGNEMYVKEENKYMNYNDYIVYLIRKMKIQEVYTVDSKHLENTKKEPFGLDFGMHALSEGLNQKEETEEWCEMSPYIANYVVRELMLSQVKLKQFYYDTGEIIDYDLPDESRSHDI